MEVLNELNCWLEKVDSTEGRLYLKRLSGNETQLTGSHQAGVYVSNEVAFDLLPALNKPTELNPRKPLRAMVASHSMPEQDVNLIWYNSKISQGKKTGRNECRITGWGGTKSPVLDPESTGSVVAFWFRGDLGRAPECCEVWLCSSVPEEDSFEDRYGPIEPGKWLYSSEVKTGLLFKTAGPVALDCRLALPDIPPVWLKTFPTGAEIISKVIAQRPAYSKQDIDARLLKRRDCEYEMFQSVEEAVVMPTVTSGFTSVGAFMAYANSVSNRRKSRSGRSLELHVKHIFLEEGFKSFSHGKVSEGNRRPDFMFPSEDAYHDPAFPGANLRMLAAKTTCKERWNQVANEAARINKKHLITLQEGVTAAQHKKMKQAGIALVVPRPLHEKYPREIRSELLTFSQFLAEMKTLYGEEP